MNMLSREVYKTELSGGRKKFNENVIGKTGVIVVLWMEQIVFMEGIIMSSTGIIILGITWILLSPLWFLAENTAMGIIWLCAGIIELIIVLIRCNKKKKNK